MFSPTSGNVKLAALDSCLAGAYTDGAMVVRTTKAQKAQINLFVLFCDGDEDGSRCHCFTSKRLAGDQLPGVPEDELARTRHHILIVGSVLVVNCETVVF